MTVLDHAAVLQGDLGLRASRAEQSPKQCLEKSW